VLAAENYPASPRKGDVIRGVAELEKQHPGVVLHAGTARDSDGNYISNGGRVLGVVGKGEDLAKARAQAYEYLEHINLEGGFSRYDIGQKAEKGEIFIPR
jgi:phosphoribosylamine--glycine ligase, chloroplastic